MTGFGGACNHTGSGRDEHISYMLPASVWRTPKNRGFTIFPGTRGPGDEFLRNQTGCLGAGKRDQSKLLDIRLNVVYTTSVTDSMVTFFPN